MNLQRPVNEHDTASTPQEPIGDVWFNPYRMPKTERAWAVVRDVWRQVQAAERFEGLRERARSPADQEVFNATVNAVVADLIHFHLSGNPGGLIVSRSHQVLGKKSRYRPAIYSKAFPMILDNLALPVMSFIEQSLGGAVDERVARDDAPQFDRAGA